MFRASLCPSSGAYQLQQQPLVYRRNVVVAVLLVVVGPAGRPARPRPTALLIYAQARAKNKKKKKNSVSETTLLLLSQFKLLGKTPGYEVLTKM
jgi:hypothetical protein